MIWFIVRLLYFLAGVGVGIFCGINIYKMLIKDASRFFKINTHFPALRTLIKAYLIMYGSNKDDKRYSEMFKQLQDAQKENPNMSLEDFEVFLKEQAIRDAWEEAKKRD